MGMSTPPLTPSWRYRSRRFVQHPTRGSGQQNGFSLVEVLVSILVLSFGLLGMVGMQAAALQSNREARVQATAVVLARELAEMVRGNKAIGVLTTANPYVGSFSSSGTNTFTGNYCLSVSAGSACGNATDIANAEITEWLARVDDQLPGARVVTCFDSAPYDVSGIPQWGCSTGAGSSYVIKIGWTRRSTNSGAIGDAQFERVSDTGNAPSLVFPVIAGSDTCKNC